jgi:hypothetical protein
VNNSSFFSALPAFSICLLVLCTTFGSLPTRAQAQVGDVSAEVVPRSQPTVDRAFELSRPMRRAVRSTRTGATLLALGGVGTLASAITWARLDDRPCPIDEPFCDDKWTKGMGSFWGMTVGSALVLTGIVTLSVGVARRNRLRRVEGLAVGVGPSRLDLSLRF